MSYKYRHYGTKSIANSIMILITALLSAAMAHTMLYSPAPKFFSTGSRNSPLLCSLISFKSTSQPKNIEVFTAQLDARFDGSLLAYFKACGSDSPKTDHDAQVPIPTDGVAKIDARSQHPGLYEFYIDDQKVSSGTWQVGQTPDSVPIDYSKCTSGKCKFRYIMVAVHQQPLQLYDNIVTIVGSPSVMTNTVDSEGPKLNEAAKKPTASAAPSVVITPITNRMKCRYNQ